MPRKRKGKKQLPKKSSPEKTSSRPPESTNRTKKWLEEVQKSKYDYQLYNEIIEINSDEDTDEFECNLKELEKPLKNLLKKFPDSAIRKRVKLECEWDKCGLETTDAKVYNNHVINHLLPLTDTLTCLWDLCKFTTHDTNDLLRHLDYHAYHSRLKTFGLGLANVISIPNCLADSKFRNIIPEIPNDYICYWNGCSKSHTKFGDFIEHVNYHIVLDYQTRNFYKRNTRERLMEIKVTCHWDGCESELPHIYQLKRHLKTHTKEKYIGCPICGTLFVSKTHYIDHCVRQVNHRSFQCPDCFKYYPTEKLLKDHTRSHINKYQCSICGLSWQLKSVLARHIRYRHMNDKPFPCEYDKCEYRGKTQRDLDSHSNVHKQGEDNRYKCEVFQCEYSSRTLMALKRHDAKVHLGQPQIYQCHCCRKEYQRGYLLSKHLKTEHAFRLAPGHSRFMYKLDYDGFYRLQTKRVEDLKETYKPMPVDEEESNVEVSYVIEKIEKQDATPINVTMKKVVRLKEYGTPSYQLFTEESAEDSKDINDFAIVRNYIKKKKLTENF